MLIFKPRTVLDKHILLMEIVKKENFIYNKIKIAKYMT